MYPPPQKNDSDHNPGTSFHLQVSFVTHIFQRGSSFVHKYNSVLIQNVLSSHDQNNLICYRTIQWLKLFFKCR